MQFKGLNFYDLKSESFQIHPENEDYAFFHSSSYQKIFGKKKFNYTDGFVKLKVGKRRIYLKYHSLPKAKGNEVALTYTNLKYLLPSDSEHDIITITKTNWFAYHAFNQKKDIKYNFWATSISVLAILCIEIPQLILKIF